MSEGEFIYLNVLPPSHLIPNSPLWANTEFQQAAVEFRVVLLSANYEATGKDREPQEPLGGAGGGLERGEARRERERVLVSPHQYWALA